MFAQVTLVYPKACGLESGSDRQKETRREPCMMRGALAALTCPNVVLV